MNLAVRDVGRHLARFLGTAGGVGLLLSVVIAMQGIYAGMVDDATILTRAMSADFWIVQRDTRGPFAEASRLDPSIEQRAAAVPGVRRARPYTYQLIQRQRDGDVLRLALIGLGWPGDTGESLPLVKGRRLAQPHGEIIVDASLMLDVGKTLELAGETYTIVGLTKNALTSGGESVAFLSVTDSHLISYDQPPEATLLERERVVERLRKTDLGRAQPNLEDLAKDPRWRPPALSSPPLAAVLVEVDPQRAAALGVSSQEIGRTLETMFGSRRATTYLRGGQEYDVVLQTDREDRSSPADLQTLYVGTGGGALVPLSSVVSTETSGATPDRRRLDRQRAITLSADLNPGTTIADAVAFMEAQIDQQPQGIVNIQYGGAARDQQEAGGAVAAAFALALLLVFLVLAAQFESWITCLLYTSDAADE